jgi:hypothetical protein
VRIATAETIQKQKNKNILRRYSILATLNEGIFRKNMSRGHQPVIKKLLNSITRRNSAIK